MTLARRSFLVISGASLACRGPLLAAKAAVNRQPFGAMSDGTPIFLYTLKNRRGTEARVMTYGAILVSLRTPDRAGRPAGRCDARIRFARRIPQAERILRRRGWSLCEPHRESAVYAQWRRVQTPSQQRRKLLTR